MMELAASKKSTKGKPRKQILLKQEFHAAFIFIMPFFIGFIIFNMIPFLYTFFISVMNYNEFKPLSSMRWDGLTNYITLFHDPTALTSYLKSFYFTIIYVPGVTIVGFLAAVLLNRKFYLKTLSRSFFLMPYVANIVAISVIFSVFFDPFGGPVNQILASIGVANPPLWFAGRLTAIPALACVATWQNFSFQMVVYLAALQSVPRELYEAAEMDGASRWKKLKNITIPLVSPASFFLIVAATIGSFQNFTIVYAFTRGGPGISSRVSAVNIYEEAFTFNHYSYAAAQAVVLFGLIMIISISQWRLQKKWVHY